MTELKRLATKCALERIEHAEELCKYAWSKCKLGDPGTQREHPLMQARTACKEAQRWLEAVLKEESGE